MVDVDRSTLAPPPDVVGPGEACRILHVGRERLRQLRQRDDFPQPRELEIGAVWDRQAIKAYHLARTQPKRRRIYVFRMQYARTGNLERSARAAGISKSTAIRWRRELEQRDEEA